MKATLRPLLLSVLIFFSSCDQLPGIIDSLPTGQNGELDAITMGNGLRQALDFGVDKEVSKLAQKDGFFKNPLTKILLPEELQKVDNALRSIGLDNAADEGLKLLNRAAEEAVAEALPIFVDAIKGITFNDAKNILLGDQDAATQFLQTRTQQALYNKFSPIINDKLGSVGATQIWSELITRYNQIPFTNDVTTDLTAYVTDQALSGVFKSIAVEELDIRSRVSSRTTTLLQQVFGYADRVKG